MSSLTTLRQIGVLEARAPRYTSYPPANHFSAAVGASTVRDWITGIAPGSRISLYVHIPYCRRLCWFCACRTQGTATDRPLAPYLEQVFAELDLIDRLLPKDVAISHLHLGGGTPTLLPPHMIRTLGERLRAFRPLAAQAQFAVEIDPTEVDKPRIDALKEIGMTRASIGVQDFHPQVQESIGRIQSFEDTARVAQWLRDAGVNSLNMDVLYGLPYQDKARMAETTGKVMSLSPDRVALFGYAHVPWMARRQVMIPADQLPDAEARFDLFETARDLFLASGYDPIGIDHFARPNDSLSVAARAGKLRRNFQGYTEDRADALIGIGASAVSRYPQGYAQNETISSRYASAVTDGQLPTVRGHAFTPEDQVRGRMIEELMCAFRVDLQALSKELALPLRTLQDLAGFAKAAYPDQVTLTETMLDLPDNGRFMARLIATALDEYAQAEGRYSRAV